AMAHAMDDGRSALMLRATRGSGDDRRSSIVWEYPHVTIPRHLRDLVITEYGIADLRGKTDEECIQALVGIMDAQFQDDLVSRAKNAGKLDRSWQIPAKARRNHPAWLKDTLADYRKNFPSYPFGSDFTEIEQRLIPALKDLKGLADNRLAMLKALAFGRPAAHPEELGRLGLDEPQSLKERAMARVLASVLSER
ncbi:MAG: acetyl-CoA hydrolase/transferase C-terminal domain-containing protein, partial [Wenzhouxiangella sp.]